MFGRKRTTFRILTGWENWRQMAPSVAVRWGCVMKSSPHKQSGAVSAAIKTLVQSLSSLIDFNISRSVWKSVKLKKSWGVTLGLVGTYTGN